MVVTWTWKVGGGDTVLFMLATVNMESTAPDILTQGVLKVDWVRVWF